MAQRKRKTSAQHLVSMATTGMPAPIRSVAGSRLGALLLLIAVPLLLTVGILQVSWNGWRPTLNINRERAQEVRKEVRSNVQQRTEGLIEQWRDERKDDEQQPIGDVLPRTGDAPPRIAVAPPGISDAPQRIGSPRAVDREPTPSFRERWQSGREDAGPRASTPTQQPTIPWPAPPPGREPRY